MIKCTVHMKFLLHEELLNIWKKALVFCLEILSHISTDIIENYYACPPNIPKALVSLSVHYVKKIIVSQL